MERDYYDHLAGNLYAAVISDVLDAASYREQTLDSRVAHSAGPEVLVGRAATMLAGEQVELEGEPYARQVEAVDALRGGEVVVATTHNSSHTAFWGELFSTAAIARGARRLVVDGLVRDRRKINVLGFPVFATGSPALQIRWDASQSTLTAFRSAAAGSVRPGDLVFAELDGMVVVPAEVEEQIISAALEKVGREDSVRRELADGSSLADAWVRHRIL